MWRSDSLGVQRPSAPKLAKAEHNEELKIVTVTRAEHPAGGVSVQKFAKAK